MNKTKIVATAGPVTQKKEILKTLIRGGIDAIRINLTYASHDFARDVIGKVQEINEELGTNVAIMLDTQGPDMRVGTFVGGQAYLKQGTQVRIYMHEIVGDNNKFSVNYENLIEEIKYHAIIKLNDGRISLEVTEKGSDYLVCDVLNDGFIEDNKSLNVPSLKLKRKFVSEKDRQDILFAHEMGVDFLALSFVSCAEDILEVNDILIELDDDHMEIIAKIENERAVTEIDEIIRVSEGIMIARGDLGVEVPMERVPSIQKTIIRKCHVAGKISIVSTELMSSMEHSDRPTRAEVSDVANAVLDGVDAVMLTGETTIGSYPVETVEVMEKIIAIAEENVDYLNLLDVAMRSEKQDITGTIAYSVTECANRLKCEAIVAPSKSGYTARKISRFRPQCPIIVLSPEAETVRSLALHFGVLAYVVDELNSFDKMILQAKQYAMKALPLEKGNKFIITGGYPFEEVKHTNFMKVEEI